MENFFAWLLFSCVSFNWSLFDISMFIALSGLCPFVSVLMCHESMQSHFRFSHTNPLHQDVFQSVARFEAEVVAMTAALLGSKEKASGGQICGNMTSGGTESILLAVKTSRDYMRAKKGITKPEMYVVLFLYSLFIGK